MKQTMKYSILAVFSANLMFGSLISVGPVADAGGGLGSVLTVLTLTSPGNSTTESGCVGWNGSANVTGASACPAGFDGGDEQAINTTRTKTEIGFNNFDSLQIIFNASEPGPNSSITVNNLALTLFNGAGSILGVYTLAAPVTFNETDPGLGNAGFGFQLDAAQAAQANAFINASGLRIGLAINASDATGGLETLNVRSMNNGGVVPVSEEVIPEPSTYALVGLSFMGLAMWKRRQRS